MNDFIGWQKDVLNACAIGCPLEPVITRVASKKRVLHRTAVAINLDAHAPLVALGADRAVVLVIQQVALDNLKCQRNLAAAKGAPVNAEDCLA